MRTKKTIAVIGATGEMGTAISKSLSRGNDRLLLYASGQDKINALVHEIKTFNPRADVQGSDCSVDCSWEADIIILAVPYKAEKEIAERIKEVANQKIVISLCNPINETFDALVTARDTSAAEELQALLPYSKVVKAFNTTFAADFLVPVINGKQVDAFLAGNNEDALQTMTQLVSVIGFNPIIAGDLSVSRTLESMQLLLIKLGSKYNYNGLAGWKILHN